MYKLTRRALLRGLSIGTRLIVVGHAGDTWGKRLEARREEGLPAILVLETKERGNRGAAGMHLAFRLF